MIELHTPKTVIGEVTLTSKMVKRDTFCPTFSVFFSLSEEVGELATELAIDEGHSKKKRGEDGIRGEAADIILCALDIMYLDGCTEDQIIELIRAKNEKWRKDKS